ncbi:hypothetical protein ZEAMMB73_Zm00001d000452 [Zea mays]|nr:hypothetical protein ZEAMMB73_Zm00001d000452 [Zea mays]ONM63250.1 hypothetical protein ZEAMMB73_Zm00001d000452 [Zea mays]ONM63251.1 hypothetical protein ZEAMMB73_Zm00001d000452 [Zea mays]
MNPNPKLPSPPPCPSIDRLMDPMRAGGVIDHVIEPKVVGVQCRLDRGWWGRPGDVSQIAFGLLQQRCEDEVLEVAQRDHELVTEPAQQPRALDLAPTGDPHCGLLSRITPHLELHRRLNLPGQGHVPCGEIYEALELRNGGSDYFVKGVLKGAEILSKEGISAEVEEGSRAKRAFTILCNLHRWKDYDNCNFISSWI